MCRAEPGTQLVRVVLRLRERLRAERHPTRAPHALFELRPMALHLEHRDAIAFVGDDDVHLPVLTTEDPDIGQHEPTVRQSFDERRHHETFRVVDQRLHRKVVGYEQAHPHSIMPQALGTRRHIRRQLLH